MLSTTLVGPAACGGDRKGAESAATAQTTADTATQTTASAAPAGGRGAELYARCATCHQANGEGIAGSFPPLAGSEWVTGNAAVPIRIVLHGVRGPLTVKGTPYNGAMMAYGTGQAMTDAEVAAVLTYVRTTLGNNAAAVTAEQVARERAATRARTTPWTATDLQPLR